MFLPISIQVLDMDTREIEIILELTYFDVIRKSKGYRI
jgi:hypothetical protein